MLMHDAVAARRSTLAAALLVPAIFVIWDLSILRFGVPDFSPEWGAVFAFAGSGWGLGATLALLVGLTRSELLSWLKRRPRGLAWSGFVDALLIWIVLVFGHDPASLQATWKRLIALLLLVLIGAFVASRLSGRRSDYAAAGWLLFCSYGLAVANSNADIFPRLLLSIMAVLAVARLLRALPPVRALTPLAVVAGSLSVLATPILNHSADARKLLSQRSVHVRTWTEAVQEAFDSDGDHSTNLFGSRDCAPGDARVFPGATELASPPLDRNCSGASRPAVAPATQKSASWGKARGRDVLVLSVDSLRSDLAAELSQTLALLGPHASFTRAVSPAAATVNSLSSALRGRLFRQVRFDRVAGLRGSPPVFDPSPTLAQSLEGSGFRALTVPTHRYLQPDTRVLAGFEALMPENPGRFVPADVAADLLLPALNASEKPFCAFIHYMEPHHPYRYGTEVGPDSLEGLKRAVRFVDKAMASLIREIRKHRGASPVVVIFGDHGEEFGDHGGHTHGTTVYAEQVLVPLIIAAPGVPEGDFAAPVSTSAVPATLLDLLGVSVPESMTVPSLLPYLTSEGTPPRIAVSEVRSLRTMNGYTFDRYRLITDPETRAAMLFDSAEDPFEEQDLASSKPGLLQRLRTAAQQWDESQ